MGTLYLPTQVPHAYMSTITMISLLGPTVERRKHKAMSFACESLFPISNPKYAQTVLLDYGPLSVCLVFYSSVFIFGLRAVQSVVIRILYYG